MQCPGDERDFSEINLNDFMNKFFIFSRVQFSQNVEKLLDKQIEADERIIEALRRCQLSPLKNFQLIQP